MRPGIVSRDSEGRSTCTPIYSRIVSLFAEQNELQYAVPGGLIGVGTTARSLSPSPCHGFTGLRWRWLGVKAILRGSRKLRVFIKLVGSTWLWLQIVLSTGL